MRSCGSPHEHAVNGTGTPATRLEGLDGPERRGALPAAQRRWRAPLLAALTLGLAALGAAVCIAPGWLPLPWALAPLHGGCVGSLQLGLACALAQAWRGAGDEALVVAPLRALSVGAAVEAVATLLSAAAEPTAHTWTWAAGAAVLAALALGCAQRGNDVMAPSERPARAWLLGATAAALAALALTLAPATVANAWPWPMQARQAAAYAGPFAALAMLAQAVARERRRYVRRALLPPLLVMAVGVLAASAWHAAARAGTFDARGASAWIWFGGFGWLAAAAAVQVRALRPRRG